MSEASARFALPFIMPGQAQKELFHNEALALLDAALHPCVEAGPIDIPPLDPAIGQGWLVGPEPSGSWAGRAHHVAVQTGAGWRFVAPVTGMSVWSKALEHPLHWTGADWEGRLPCAGLVVGGLQVVGERLPAIATPSAGTIIDAEARSAIAQLIATFRQHGLTQ